MKIVKWIFACLSLTSFFIIGLLFIMLMAFSLKTRKHYDKNNKFTVVISVEVYVSTVAWPVVCYYQPSKNLDTFMSTQQTDYNKILAIFNSFIGQLRKHRNCQTDLPASDSSSFVVALLAAPPLMELRSVTDTLSRLSLRLFWLRLMSMRFPVLTIQTQTYMKLSNKIRYKVVYTYDSWFMYRIGSEVNICISWTH